MAKHGSMEQKKELFELFAISFSVILAGLLLYNSFSVSGISGALDSAIASFEENSLPKVGVLVIKPLGCNECSVDKVVSFIKSQGLDVNSEREIYSDSAEAMGIISKYNIEKLPALLVSGEWQGTQLESAWAQFGSIESGTLVYRNAVPPFYDLNEKRLRGIVSLTAIEDSRCAGCADIGPVVSQLEQVIYVGPKKTIDYGSQEAQKLVQKFSIERLPAIILSSDLEEYPSIADAWGQIGSVEATGEYVTRQYPVPYVDLNTGIVKGLVKLRALTDENCSDCFDVNSLDGAFRGFGMNITRKDYFDINSEMGKQLLKDYNISAVPTVLLSSDANEYSAFVSAWEQVGSVEQDGTFILRNLALLKVKYENVPSG